MRFVSEILELRLVSALYVFNYFDANIHVRLTNLHSILNMLLFIEMTVTTIATTTISMTRQRVGKMSSGVEFSLMRTREMVLPPTTATRT